MELFISFVVLDKFLVLKMFVYVVINLWCRMDNRVLKLSYNGNSVDRGCHR